MTSIRIDISKCVGDGICVDACPNNVLDLIDGVAKVVNPDKCEGCGTCEAVCTQHAIKVIDERT
jgi:NAD-dependent dihydropyrimidine dehydrogenase PreA subunit